MLVITRKNNESIIIQVPSGNSESANGYTNIEIAILDSSKEKVKIGVNAPRNVKIIRNELMIAEAFNVEASKAVPKDALDALLKLKK